MLTLVRSLRLLAITIWVGGLVFFAFILAPVAFSLLPSTHEAGIVVGGTLRVLHVVGLACGSIFLASTTVLIRLRRQSEKLRFGVELALVCIMLSATAYLQVSVLPAMESDRTQAGGNIEAASETSIARRDFERRHRLSEHIEGVVLLCGLGVVLLVAGEPLQL